MANTHNVGKFYWHTMVYPIKPPVLLDKAETQQIEEPYYGGKGWALRLPFTRLAIVVGKWTAAYSESVAFTRAINGRGMLQGEFDWDILRYGGESEDL